MILGTVASQFPIPLPDISYLAIAPDLVLFGAALLMLLIAALIGSNHLRLFRLIALIAAVVQGFFSAEQLHATASGGSLAIAGAIAVDGLSSVIGLIVSATLVLAVLIGTGFIRKVSAEGPEYLVLLLVSALGALVMAQAEDLIVVFLGLEILSIALYVLTSFRRGDLKSREAAFKYFILGGFSSAVFLYGIALIYGATGSTNLVEISKFLASNVLIHDGILLFGIGLLLVGFGFKVAAVPFHIWSPDVYEGAPTSITGYMAAMAKIGAFAALLRVFDFAFATEVQLWRPMVAGLALASMFFGALFALRQPKVKRLLAYSSINHAGFILIGVYVSTSAGVRAAVFYLAIYSVLVVGTFGVISAIQERNGDTEGSIDLDGLRGLAHSDKVVAFILSILLLAQAGAPFTSGFVAKFLAIVAAVGVGEYWLAVLAMIAAVIAMAFYLRVVLVMIRSDRKTDVSVPVAVAGAASEPPRIRLSGIHSVGIWLSLVVTIAVGIFPQPLLALIAHATIVR
jgi:NADH-quinone oxidoreductase subunit N